MNATIKLRLRSEVRGLRLTSNLILPTLSIDGGRIMYHRTPDGYAVELTEVTNGIETNQGSVRR
jgi:hypothetical protein